MCTSEDAVAVTSMSKELKQGFVMRLSLRKKVDPRIILDLSRTFILIFRYKKRLFGSNWREGILTLHEDSTGRLKFGF